MDYAVETQGLNKVFGKIAAVRDLALRVVPGETYGLLGPNGSGKSTLIRMLVGLVKPNSGRITVLGRVMPDRNVLADVGYMTQASALYQDLTIRENLDFFGGVYGAGGRERIAELLGLVELSDRADSLVRTLSGGMRQRVSLICALLHRPRLLLLDEPTVGIDPVLRVQFWDYFRRLNGEGVTIIVSSHAMDEAERCDRLGFMREGRLLAEGTPQELRTKGGTASLEQAFLAFAGGPDVLR